MDRGIVSCPHAGIRCLRHPTAPHTPTAFTLSGTVSGDARSLCIGTRGLPAETDIETTRSANYPAGNRRGQYRKLFITAKLAAALGDGGWMGRGYTKRPRPMT